MSAPDDRRAAVLVAVAYAAQRHADPGLSEIIAQLRAPRADSGQGVLPCDLSGSQVERDLTALRRAGLVLSVPAAGSRGRRRWLVSDAGRRAGAERGLTLPEPYLPAPGAAG